MCPNLTETEQCEVSLFYKETDAAQQQETNVAEERGRVWLCRDFISWVLHLVCTVVSIFSSPLPRSSCLVKTDQDHAFVSPSV